MNSYSRPTPTPFAPATATASTLHAQPPTLPEHKTQHCAAQYIYHLTATRHTASPLLPSHQAAPSTPLALPPPKLLPLRLVFILSLLHQSCSDAFLCCCWPLPNKPLPTYPSNLLHKTQTTWKVSPQCRTQNTHALQLQDLY